MFIQRESFILKKSVIEPIQRAVTDEKMLSIVYKDARIKVAPIGIEPAREGTFQYLIALQNDAITSIRLSRIQSVKILPSAARVPHSIKERAIETLTEYGPTFIQEPVVTIKVRFTKEGLESYQYSVIHRPLHIAVEDDNVFVFRCSELQAIYFFFRFVGTAEIIEPLSLRNKFKEMYQNGLSLYP